MDNQEQYNSGWENFASWAVSPFMLARRAEEVLSKLAARGVRIPGGNRIHRAIKLTDALNDSEALRRATPDDLKLAREAFRSLWEFFFICYTAFERPRSARPLTNDRLETLFRGADDPDGESNSAARDTQFELLVAALFVLGGADVHSGEPDFRFLYHGREVGVACKRVRSLKANALRDAMRDAAHQIQGSTKVGFIAVNLDTRVEDLAVDSTDVLGVSFNEKAREAHDLLFDLSEKDALLGGIFFGTQFAWNRDGDTPRIEFHMPLQIKAFTETELDVSRVREFFEPFQARIGNAIGAAIPLVSRRAT